MKSFLKKLLKKLWRSVIHVGKKYRVTNDLLENKIFPLINKYRHGGIKQQSNVRVLYGRRFKYGEPFRVKRSTHNNTRINILYNDFDKKSFFGGKATALIIANLLAVKNGYDLRIIGTNIHPEVYDTFLDVFGMDRVNATEFNDFNKNNTLEVSDNDYFIATNGFNARSVLDNPLVKNRSKLFYIMQEVETMFYDHGDDYLYMSQTMRDSKIIPIVNTKLLYDWFCDNEYRNVENNGKYFEPAFPLSYKNRNPNKKASRPYKLFFYARPGHQRNLFYFGIKILNQAFLTGKLNPTEWVVYISDDGTTPMITFDSEVKIEKLKAMDWLEYNEFLKDIDITYSMIYTPHPSYPPLDTAVMGGVCVTNTYKNKRSLSKYSKNILTAELTEDSMLEAFGEANKIVKDDDLRRNNYDKNNINSDWDKSLEEVVNYMRDTIKNV